jgi:hypothetical protein
MTHDERISSYIDNELTTEQEQEFLISLAASDGLRRSFRSELVMKNIMHHQEANPPRRLRGAVFAAVGIGAASTIATQHASAMTAKSTTSAIKSLFATKVGALVTAGAIGTSALIGYGVRTATEPAQNAPGMHAVHSVPAPVKTEVKTEATPNVAEAPQSSSSKVSDRHQHAVSVKHEAVATKSSDNVKTSTSQAGPVNGMAGVGQVSMTPATVDTK